MVKHPRRTIAQTAVAVGVLAVLGGGAWFAATTPIGPGGVCIPCQEPVPVEALVPSDVDFVLATSWPALKSAGWIRENLIEEAILPGTQELLALLAARAAAVDGELERLRSTLWPERPALTLEEDILRGELVVAGRFCEDVDPASGPPTWREVLLLTRISGRLADALATLTTEEAAARLTSTLAVRDVGDGVVEIVVEGFEPTPVAERMRCGPGDVVPPESVWYALRLDDVVAFGNSELLLREIARLGARPAEERGEASPSVSAPPIQLGTVAARADLRPLPTYLRRLLEHLGPPATVARGYLTISALTSLEARVDATGFGGLRLEAEVGYDAEQLSPGVRAAYALGPVPRGAVASLVPAEDTFALLTLRTPPRYVLELLFQELFTPGDRRLWEENLRRLDEHERAAARLDDVVASLGETWSVAAARLSHVYDAVDYGGFFEPVDIPDPDLPVLALFVSLPDEADPNVVGTSLFELAPLTGVASRVHVTPYRGVELYEIEREIQTVDGSTIRPAYAIAAGHLIVASHEAYLRKIVDAIVEPDASPPLSTDATWRATAGHLTGPVHLGLFVDLGKLVQVPPDASPEGRPRGYLWDRRRIWVAEHFDLRTEAVRFRQQLLREHGARGESPDAAAARAIDEQVDRHADAWLDRFPEFLEIYRQELLRHGRLRGLGVGIVADASVLRVEARLGVEPAGER